MSGSTGVRDSWKAAWRNAAFRIQILVTVPVLLAVLSFFSRFLEWVEARPGAVLHDPLVAAIPVVDFTWPIFVFIYAGLIIGLVTLSANPAQLMMALQSYVLMVLIRIVAMALTPLDPPAGLVPLADPFVQFFGGGDVPTKDLFFSGHVSTLLLLSLTATNRRFKTFFAMCAIIVGILIVWQHVHYTVDVLVAPFIAYTSYRLIRLFHERFIYTGED